MSGGVPAGERRALSWHEQIQDAQKQCVPCKLCGGKAIIRDAGIGAGYYITCENGGTFRASDGCLISDRRLGGWAYNVMEWWNRLMATPTPPIEDRDADVERAIAEAIGKADVAFGYSFNLTRLVDGEETHTLTMPGFEPVDFEDRDEGYALIAERRNAMRASAIRAALQALGERG